MNGLTALGVFRAFGRTVRNALLVAAHALIVTHVAVLAFGDLVVRVVGIEEGGIELPLALASALLPVGREHELREGALHVEVGTGGVQFSGKRLRRVAAQVGQHRVRHVVAGGAHVLALVVAAVEHLVPCRRVGEGSALGTVGAYEVLARTVLGIGRAERAVGRVVERCGVKERYGCRQALVRYIGGIGCGL